MAIRLWIPSDFEIYFVEPTVFSTTTPRTMLKNIWYPEPIQIIPDPNPSHWDEINKDSKKVSRNNSSKSGTVESRATTENLFPLLPESTTKKTIIVKVPKVHLFEY